jgi:N-acetylneuraminic acid mutarotase
VKTVFLGAFGLLLAAVLVSAGTMAYFLRERANQANFVSTGITKLSIKEPNNAGLHSLDIGGLKPGQAAFRYITVANDSSPGMELKWKAWITPDSPILTWNTRASLSAPRRGPGIVATTNGKIYAFGGSTAVGVVASTVEEYDPAINVWSAKASMPTARYALAAAQGDNGKIFAIGGRNQQPTGIVEEYSIPVNSWATRSAMPTPRDSMAAIKANNGRIYVFGGFSASGPTNTVEEYNPATDTWALKAPMPTPRGGVAGAQGSNGKIYIIGGKGPAGNAVDTVEEYDPANNTWAARVPLPEARAFATAAPTNGGSIFAFGGENSSGDAKSSVMEYQMATNRWSLVENMPLARVLSGAALATNGKMYVIGGGAGVACYNVVEEATVGLDNLLQIKVTERPISYSGYSALTSQGYGIIGVSDRLVTDYTSIGALGVGNNVLIWATPQSAPMPALTALVYKWDVKILDTALYAPQNATFAGKLNLTATQYANEGWNE